jgi:hypothetical protein
MKNATVEISLYAGAKRQFCRNNLNTVSKRDENGALGAFV